MIDIDEFDFSQPKSIKKQKEYEQQNQNEHFTSLLADLKNNTQLTSRDTKHSIGNVSKIDTENKTRAKFIRSSFQQ